MCLNFKALNRFSGPRNLSSPLPGRARLPHPCPSRCLWKRGASPLPGGAPAGNTPPLSQGGPSPSPTRGYSFGLNVRLKTRFGCSRFCAPPPPPPESIGALFLQILVFGGSQNRASSCAVVARAKLFQQCRLQWIPSSVCVRTVRPDSTVSTRSLRPAQPRGP